MTSLFIGAMLASLSQIPPAEKCAILLCSEVEHYAYANATYELKMKCKDGLVEYYEVYKRIPFNPTP